MDLENIMISEMSEKDKYCMISLYKESKKIKQTNEYNKKEADTENNQWLPVRREEEQYRSWEVGGINYWV